MGLGYTDACNHVLSITSKTATDGRYYHTQLLITAPLILEITTHKAEQR